MRVSWKIPVVLKLFNKQNNLNEFSWAKFFFKNPNIRNITIPVTLVGKVVYIYNGRFLNNLYITSKMVGHKFGEFSITKTLGKDFHLASEYKKKKKKKNKR
jgi:ribosomal protein S19